MARVTRELSQQQTRSRLLDGARKVFGQHGYAGASIDMISETAGYSKGAFYSNFESKEAIFLDLLEAHMAGEVSASAAFLGEDDSAQAAIARIADRYASDPADLAWCLLSIEFALHATRSETFARRREALFKRHYEKVAQLISAIATRAGGHVDDPSAAAAIFVALRQGLALDRSLPAPALTENAVRTTLEAWMLNLVGLGRSPKGQGAKTEVSAP